MRTRPLPYLKPSLDEYRDYISETVAIGAISAEMVRLSTLIGDDDALKYHLHNMIGSVRLARDVMRDLDAAKATEIEHAA
jgi:hypothetical protein